VRILLIGDSCDDVYKYGACTRLCPEAPVPVFIPSHERRNGGMLLNVLANIKALGESCDILTNAKRPTKTRLVEKTSNQVIVRIDEDDVVDPISRRVLLNKDFSGYDAVVISDYDKGFLSPTQIRFITEKNKLVFLDSKKKLDDWARKVSFIKINYAESKISMDWLKGRYLAYKGDLIVTKGRDGATLNFERDFPIKDKYPIRDLTGAGDTFLAALVVSYLRNGGGIEEAIIYANRCASWVVTQKGVVSVDVNKI